jgi:hypothetical protein
MFAFYLAHALLGAIGVSADPTPAALAHRKSLRGEARTILESLVEDPVHGRSAKREIEAMERRRIAADAIAAEVALETAATEAIAAQAAANAAEQAEAQAEAPGTPGDEPAETLAPRPAGWRARVRGLLRRPW